MSLHLPKAGKITTIETDPWMAVVARKIFIGAGVLSRVDLRVGDARKVIPLLAGSIDLLFLDGAKEQYLYHSRTVDFGFDAVEISVKT